MTFKDALSVHLAAKIKNRIPRANKFLMISFSILMVKNHEIKRYFKHSFAYIIILAGHNFSCLITLCWLLHTIFFQHPVRMQVPIIMHAFLTCTVTQDNVGWIYFLCAHPTIIHFFKLVILSLLVEIFFRKISHLKVHNFGHPTKTAIQQLHKFFEGKSAWAQTVYLEIHAYLRQFTWSDWLKPYHVSMY